MPRRSAVRSVQGVALHRGVARANSCPVGRSQCMVTAAAPALAAETASAEVAASVAVVGLQCLLRRRRWLTYPAARVKRTTSQCPVLSLAQESQTAAVGTPVSRNDQQSVNRMKRYLMCVRGVIAFTIQVEMQLRSRLHVVVLSDPAVPASGMEEAPAEPAPYSTLQMRMHGLGLPFARGAIQDFTITLARLGPQMTIGGHLHFTKEPQRRQTSSNYCFVNHAMPPTPQLNSARG